MTSACDLPDVRQSATSLATIGQSIAELQAGARRLASSSLDERLRWAKECVESTFLAAADWVRDAARAKGLPPVGSAVAEEILGGPASVLRFLQLTIQTLEDLRSSGEPRLPRRPRTIHGQIRVTTFPTRSLYDAMVFQSISAETWLQPDASPDAIFGDVPARLTRRLSVSPRIALVLGAGNVAAIPATDALTMIFQNDCAVLLKMNPVNEYLGPVFEKALQPLIQAGILRIIYGGAEQGGYGVNDPRIDLIHITGSAESHDAIVWGPDAEARQQRKQLDQPLVTKPVSSELGNVTPWIVVPGEYSDSQLAAQAENIAASIINNASFNCIASKVLVTWKRWPARERFLDMISAILQRTPARYAYYPGAATRFCEFSGGQHGPDDQGRLPWTLRRGVDPEREPHLFERESFVCVTGETSIDGSSPLEFLDKAVEFSNERIWGSLAVALTVPDSMRKKHASDLDSAIRRLCYGTVGLNQWPGVAYGLMSPPWGGYPDASLSRVGSGIGFVHNTYLLNRPQKTILRSPLTMFPKPVWFSTNRRAESISWRLTALYARPSVSKLLPLFGEAIRG